LIIIKSPLIYDLSPQFGDDVVKSYAMYIGWLEWRLGDSLGISVTDETLERATRVKRLIGRPQESAQAERKSTLRY